MSTLQITFTLQVLDFSPLNRGGVDVIFNDGISNKTLRLNLTTSVPGTGFFQEVGFVSGEENERNEQQAQNFVFAFNRDYKNIGGTKNLVATYSANVVTITATTGTFNESLSNYDGNIFGSVDFVENNSPQTNPPTLKVVRTTNGDCDNVDVLVSASGDGAPFRLSYDLVPVNTGWDGSEITVSVPRGRTIFWQLREPAPSFLILDSFNFFVPRKLAEGDFNIKTTDSETSSDIVVERALVIANTSPLEYSLESDTEASTGTSYQTSNTFPGIPKGAYKLFIRDVYGCEISKQISTEDAIPNTSGEENIEVNRHFEIMEGQSFIFFPNTEHGIYDKKNYFNTGSKTEFVEGSQYRVRHVLAEGETKFHATQFKSTFPYHYISLLKCDGTKIDLSPIIISENLGAQEKYDCVLFPYSETQTGVYFTGGNQYTAGTTEVIGASPYDGVTPSWAKTGQVVSINSTTVTIVGTGFDENRGGFFLVDIETPTEASGFVELTYNKQNYNLFEFFLNPNDVDQECFLVVEKSLTPGGEIVGESWVSELICKKEDKDSILLLEWSSDKNKADIVFQSGITFQARIKGRFLPVSNTESDTYSGDGNEYSIEQIVRMDFELIFEELTFRQVNQINIASALSGFKVNGLSLIPKSEAKPQRLGTSNLYSWERTFGFGVNKVAEQGDQIVYSPTTGVLGGGGTGKTTAADLSNITLYKDENGNLVVNESGTLIKN